MASDLKFIFLPFLKKTWLLQKCHFSKRDVHLFIMAPVMTLRYSESFPSSGTVEGNSCPRNKAGVTPSWGPPTFCSKLQPMLVEAVRAGLSSAVVTGRSGETAPSLINLYMLFPLRYHSVLPSHPCLCLLGLQLPGANCVQKSLSGKCQK